MPQSCCMRCNEKLRKMMVNPYQSKKVKYFHTLLALTLYVDIIMTSLLMGNWKFITTEGSNQMYNS
jgi:hypothetical protein